MKVLGIGNCQVSKLAILFRHFNPGIKFKYLTNTTRFGKFDGDQIWDELKSSDFVISQPIMNKENNLYYENIVKEASGRIVFVPYIFVDGIFSLVQAPRMNVSAGQGHIFGSEELERHFTPEQSSIRSALDLMRVGGVNFNNVSRFEGTMTELLRREKLCHVSISDFIKDMLPEKLPMISHNHPMPEVLVELYDRIAKVIGLNPKSPIDWVVTEQVTLEEKPRVFSPYDAAALGLKCGHDLQWGNHARKLVNVAWRQWRARTQAAKAE